jgi:hypothetical protein
MKSILTGLIFLIPVLLVAQNEASYPSPSKKRNSRIVLFPVLVKSPEYILGAGGAGTYFFRIGHDSLTRTSSFKAVSFFTLRKQAVVASEGYVFFPNERYILHVTTSLSRFPDKFWGLGNTTPAGNLENYAISQYGVFPQITRNLFSDFYAGIGYEYQTVFKFDYDRSGESLFDLENITGRDGGKISGTGILISWDSRNNAFSPSRGFYVQYYTSAYRKSIGSDFNFNINNLDVRKYFPLTRERVLAFQANLISTNKDVPIRNMANIGSNSYMRGYYEGRYTDRNLLTFQSEFRFPVYKRWGMVAFSGIGKVGHFFKEVFNAQHLKPSAGIGLRFALKPKEKLNLRVDQGFGKKSQGSYLNLGEAF